MGVMVGSARIDENGKAYNGKAGDQTGKEVSTQAYYVHSKGWRVIRAIDPIVRKKIAACMKAACANNKIGYDQYQRNTLYKLAEPFGFDVSKVTTACETDCSALVRVCCAYAGITGLPAEFRTVNMCATLLKTGKFIELTGSKYTEQSAYLAEGDILCTKTSGHTVVVLNSGTKVGKDVEAPTPPTPYKLGERMLKNGCEGADVKQLQLYLIQLGFSCGSYGADGDYGDATEIAVENYQRANGSLEVDGIAGSKTIAALLKDIDKDKSTNGNFVRIINGDCYCRSEPNTGGARLGVCKRGYRYIYGGVSEGGWNLIEFEGVNGWVSGKYSEVVT